jgi:hypothetical protein
MPLNWKAAVYFIALVAGLTISAGALAQGAVNFKVAFAGQVDCEQPIQIKNVPIGLSGTGILNPDGTGSADITETAFILSTTIHFDGRLGAPPKPGPGGSTQARVAGPHALLLTWNLPNNQVVLKITVHGGACTAAIDARLLPGKKLYSLFDGQSYHYCSRPRIVPVSCEVQ